MAFGERAGGAGEGELDFTVLLYRPEFLNSWIFILNFNLIHGFF